jgi:hypothetical protein
MPHIDRDTFRKIFIKHWAIFIILHPSYLKSHIIEVVNKMLGCGKEAGGYSEYSCFNCGGDFRRIPFTCKSGFCLSCAKVHTDNFVTRVRNCKLFYRNILNPIGFYGMFVL